MKSGLHGSAIAAAIWVLASSCAWASTVSFSLKDAKGSASSDTDVVLTDILGGVKFSYTVNDPVNTADLAAVYFDIGGSFPTGMTVGSEPIVTGFRFDTSNVQAGNIGQTFDIGIAIGKTGSGSDFYNSFTFDVLGTDLDVTDFFGQTFAVRGQTVGPPTAIERALSSKQYGKAPTAVDPVTPVPVPAAAWMLLAGLAGLGALSRRKSV